MRLLAGDSAVMIATGEGESPPARGVEWLYATALTRRELDWIDAQYDRSLSDPPRLAYLGRLSPEKGVAVLIRALAQLKNEKFEPLPHAVLIGDGPQQAELEALARSIACEDLPCPCSSGQPAPPSVPPSSTPPPAPIVVPTGGSEEEAEPTFQAYIACSLSRYAPRASSCPHRSRVGAFFRSSEDVEYEVCVRFPTGRELCDDQRRRPSQGHLVRLRSPYRPLLLAWMRAFADLSS